MRHVLLLFVLSIVAALPYSVLHKNGKWRVLDGRRQDAVGWATYENKMQTTGWVELTVESNPNSDDELQAFGAGFLEGWLTHAEIYNISLNFQTAKRPLAPAVRDFPSKTMSWLRSQAKTAPTDSYWRQVSLVVKQFEGILAGYNARAPSARKWTESELLGIQLITELGDINSTAAYVTPVDEDLHCSSLVKLTADGKRLFAAHNSWTTFTWMLRVYKHFKLNFSENPNSMSYSSYPGVIPSIDDFFITGQNIVVMETTNEVFNSSLYKFVVPETVPYWVRIMVANRIAKSGQQWSEVFSKHNSGTYNNQWIIVDNKKFTPGKPLSPGALWIVEQIPGYIESADQTEHLQNKGYWASYNIAFYPFIYNISGYPQKAATSANNSLSYTQCPRAQIFARDQGKVSSLDDMKKIMRYNKFQTDPLSLGNSCNSISSRCDLNFLGKMEAFGAIDAKLTEASLAAEGRAEVVSGPTWDSQPPFAWNDAWSTVPHHGHAEVYAFKWETMTPQFNLTF